MFNIFNKNPVQFEVNEDHGFVEIQILDSFSWRTVHYSHPNPGIVRENLKTISELHNGVRTKAIDGNGNLVDML